MVSTKYWYLDGFRISSVLREQHRPISVGTFLNSAAQFTFSPATWQDLIRESSVSPQDRLDSHNSWNNSG